MSQKKSKSANLESKRGLFFTLGMVICSSVVLMAFTYSNAIDNTVADKLDKRNLDAEIVYELPPLEEPPEEIPEQQYVPPVVIDQINIVDNDIKIDEVDFIDINDQEYFIVEDDFDKVEAEPIYEFAEVEPTFPGGEAEMMRWIQNEITYPEEAVMLGEQGTVYVQFVVNKDGSIEQVNIARGAADSLDKEAKRVVKKMPKWSPGEQAGKKVRCKFTLPIDFQMN